MDSIQTAIFLSNRRQFSLRRWLALPALAGCLLGSPVHGAEGLPPLRADPDLLGGARPAQPTSSTAQQQAPATPTVTPVAPPAVATTAETAVPPAPTDSDNAATLAADAAATEASVATPVPAPASVDASPASRLPRQAAAKAAPAATTAPTAKAQRPLATPLAERTHVVKLPPLRVDPALLGGATAIAATPAAAAAEATAAVSATSSTTTVKRDSSATHASTAAAGATRMRSSAVTAAPTSPTLAGVAVKSLPPLRVDPALLGGAAPTQSTEPPQVAAAPELPATYSAYADAGLLPGVKLKGTRRLTPHPILPGEVLPAFITADRIDGKVEDQVAAAGEVELRRRDTVLNADRLVYHQASDEVDAEGNVVLLNEGGQMDGPKMHLKLGDSTGFFEQPIYSIRQPKVGSPPVLWTVGEEADEADLTTGQGAAARLDFEGKGKYQMTDATYSTCTPAEGSGPAWFARTAGLTLDYDKEVGTANDAAIYFGGVPILYTPWMDFSLNNQRKSGFLPPTFGNTTRGGIEYTQPYYWDIAPNLDATFGPRFIVRRGVMMTGEFRYLEPDYKGTFDGQYLPNDRLADRNRSAFTFKHSQNFGYGFTGSLDISNASDGTYFSDLGHNSAIIAQTNLLRQGQLNYGADWWSASMLAQSYKVLQDPALPTLATPYRRMPQFNLNAERADLPLGLDVAFNGEYVDFRNPDPSTVEGRRAIMYPQVSLPLRSAGAYLIPKVGFHMTRYQLTGQAAGTPDSLTRNVPILSLDTGMTFERDSDWFDMPLTQTLEPRLYYLYVPARDQSKIPVFDSAPIDYNFAQLFSENRYTGGDRIGDANQLTGVVTSRLIDESGVELMRAALGQQIYFSSQRVSLPSWFNETVRSDRQMDVLAALSGRIWSHTHLDTTLQYNTRDSQVERFDIRARYQPEISKVLNIGYRFTRNLADTLGQVGTLIQAKEIGQVDISGQWPLSGGWYGVGRYNYSTYDNRLVEGVMGFEYDGGCWVGRVVLQRLATLTKQYNNSFFFQIELNGLAKLGSNPLELLKRTVPGYGALTQPNDTTNANADILP